MRLCCSVRARVLRLVAACRDKKAAVAAAGLAKLEEEQAELELLLAEKRAEIARRVELAREECR